MLAAFCYRMIYRVINLLLPSSTLSQYLKWKLALVLVGTEFHRDNLVRNRHKLAQHFDANTPLQPELAALLPKHNNGDVKVLDIGAGPISKIGKILNGKPIALTPIDPIAVKYQALLDELNLVAPVPTQTGCGERLKQLFGVNQFDLIHARNSIDHCREPLEVIRQALAVLKPQCYFYLNHYRNEGKAANYYGLHQWNFDVEDGNFVISDAFGKTVNVDHTFNDLAYISSIETTAERIVVVIKKR